MPSRRVLLATLAATAVAPLLAGAGRRLRAQGASAGAAALLGPRPEIRGLGEVLHRRRLGADGP